MVELLVVGGGKMGEALVGGLLDSGRDPASIVVVEPSGERRAVLSEALPAVATAADLASVEVDAAAGAGAIVAVKPQHALAVCSDLASIGGVSRILSIAAGVTIASIESVLPDGRPVVRAMPNTPALVGSGAAAISGGTSSSEADMEWAESILGAVGSVVRVDESQLDAVTGLSGSGPAYVFLVAEALIDAGVEQGLPRSVATDLAVQTLRGAAEMLATGRPAAELRSDVTSPGGTTAAGLRALEDAAVRGAFARAVAAATARSRELS